MDDNFILAVLKEGLCEKHDVGYGWPCFIVEQSTRRGYTWGICNERALKAGFNGTISPKSLRK